MKGPKNITDRRREVLYWMARGKSNAEIGAILGISPCTVKQHVEQIGFIYGCPNRISMVLRGIARGDIAIEPIVREFV